MEGHRAPDAGEFLQRYGDQVRRRSSTDVDAHLRRALREYCDGSIQRAAASAVRAFIRDPRYCTWRLRQRGLAPHDPRWGGP